MPLSTPIVVSRAPDGHVDFMVPLEKLVPTDRGFIGLFASAQHSGHEVAFKIMLAPGLRPGFVNNAPDEDAIRESGVLLFSDGAPSDVFVRCVAESWGMKGRGLAMAEQVPFTCVATQGDPQNLRAEEVRFKLFTGSDGDEDDNYAEWYLTLHVHKGYAEFTEKHVRYRANLILAMTGF